LVFQNVQTNTTVRIDVGVVYFSIEFHFGGFERIVGRKLNGKEKDSTLVG
jgi:hypothetical protein